MRGSAILALLAVGSTTTCTSTGRLASTPVAPAAVAEASSIGIQAPMPEAPAELRDDTTPVVLVVLDGVRWQEMFGGVDAPLAASHRVGPVVGARTLMPSLYAALDDRGAALGAPGHGTISASGPNFVSLPGYTEIFSGHPPDACHDNDCRGATSPTLVDAFRDRATRAEDVAVITSWEPIARAATTSRGRIVISAGRSEVSGGQVFDADPPMRDLLDQGFHAGPRPGHDSFRPDRYTAALALRYLETQSPSFLFVGLGEADEYAHQDDYGGYLGALRTADAFFGDLFSALDRMGDRGRRTLVMVTADHGRARDYRDHGGALPESARVWLLAIGGPVQARGLVEVEDPRHLADVAPTIRQMAGLPSDEYDKSARAGKPLLELLPRSATASISRRE